MYTLKQIAQRGTAWGGVAAFVVAAVAPLAQPAFADALNPLTDRSLTLSSSAPGWENYDGSGNPTYAQPNSGANGQKTGNTFDFKVSSSATVKGFSFQYCTTSAGECRAPGDNAVHGTDTTTTSDLKVVVDNPTEVSDTDTNGATDGTDTDFSKVVGTDGNIKAVPGFTDPAVNSTPATTGQYAAHDLPGNFVVYYNDGGTWTQSTGWTMTVSNEESSTQAAPDDNTGQDNYITLANEDGQAFTAGQQVKVVFFGTDDNYIQNPGSGAFFVKINTYSSDTSMIGDHNDDTPADTTDHTVIDGGVTVANVMNHSIRIQTKVLETMKFSVGTVDPNTLDSTGGLTSDYGKATNATKHIPCDPIVGGLIAGQNVNVLKLGNQAAESSLSDQDTYATHSYWRLSSNSSAGATVYYSGVTLSNTVGDKIAAIGPDSSVSTPGAEQFGLAFMNGSEDDQYAVDYSQVPTYENGADNGKTSVHASVVTDLTVGGVLNGSWHTPKLYPLVPNADYAYGAGDTSDDGSGDPVNAGETDPGTFGGGGKNDTTAAFAFDETSNSIPVALATEDSQVVDCVTGKMRYVANIASTTPAGIYTTAVNYIAAPQY